MSTDNYLTAKGTAVEIRAWLKARGIKPVRVFKSRGGSSVTAILRKQDYSQELGFKIKATFEAGEFDGMTDSYNYRTDANYTCADGAVRQLCCRYIFVEPEREVM